MEATTPTRQWRDYVMASRWFQGKGLPVGQLSLTPLPWYTLGETVQVRSELAKVEVSGVSWTYHLLVGYLPLGQAEPSALVGQVELPGRGLVDMVDAPQSPRAMAALLEAWATTGAPGLRWCGAAVDPHAPTTVFTGEQSNTTVRIGDDVLFKIFRRLDPGPSLESTTLARLADSGITPRLIGVLATPRETATEGFDLGIFVERIEHDADGWAYCVRAGREARPIDTEMADLGATLRRLHRLLAQAFPTVMVDTSVIGADMAARLDAAVVHAPELAEVHDQLRAIFDLRSGPIQAQRVHGDFHLGQALLSDKGWTIIDFEGEPLKTPAERAAPDTVWRDVAGLLRSLDYARSTAQRETSHDLDQWRRQARQAFLAGYLGDTPLPRRLLAAYEVDKAIYELLYEIRNRPSWAPIPRQAIHDALKNH